MIQKIELTLNNGRKVELKPANTLADCDKLELVSLVFTGGEIYTGWLMDIDKIDGIRLCKQISKNIINLKYDMLMGWFYE